MSNQELLNYIQQSRDSGLSDEQIKEQLRNSGWSDLVTGKLFEPANKFTENNSSSKKRLIFAFIVGSLLNSVFLIASFFYIDNGLITLNEIGDNLMGILLVILIPPIISGVAINFIASHKKSALIVYLASLVPTIGAIIAPSNNGWTISEFDLSTVVSLSIIYVSLLIPAQLGYLSAQFYKKHNKKLLIPIIIISLTIIIIFFFLNAFLNYSYYRGYGYI